jgi:hypothetical protein
MSSFLFNLHENKQIMKAIIKEVIFSKEGENKFGKFYSFKVKYDEKLAFYNSKDKDQKKFIAGQEAEFTEEEKIYKDNNGNPCTYWVIKPLQQNKQSNFGKALKKEQSRYSGFADSYVKDLMASGIIKPEKTEQDEADNDIIMNTWKKRSFEIFEHMVNIDKTLES